MQHQFVEFDEEQDTQMILDKVRSARQLRKNQIKSGMVTLNDILKREIHQRADGKHESYMMLHPIGNQ